MGFSFPMPTLSLQSAVVKGAHEHDFIAVAHSLCLEDTLAILGTGVDGMAHTFADQPPTPALIEAYKKNNAFCIPTLGVLASATSEGKALQHSFANDPRVTDKIGVVQREMMCGCMEFAAKTSKMENAYESVRQLKAAGIEILWYVNNLHAQHISQMQLIRALPHSGSDAASPARGTAWGLSLHLELHYLVHECGFTPEEALRAATSVNARRFRFHDRGLIAVGRKADLLLIEGNPLESIGDMLNLKSIWRDGHEL